MSLMNHRVWQSSQIARFSSHLARKFGGLLEATAYSGWTESPLQGSPVPLGVHAYTVTVSDSLTLTDTAPVKARTLVKSETVALTDTRTKSRGLVKSDTATLSDVCAKSRTHVITGDVCTPSDTIAKTHGLGRTETITLTDAAPVKARGLVKSETVTLTDTRSKSRTYTLTDTTTLTGVCKKTPGHVISDTCTTTDTIAKARGHVETGTVSLTDAVAKTPGLGIANSLTLTDTRTKARGLVRLETVTLTDVQAKSRTYHLTDSSTLTDVCAKTPGLHRTETALSLTDSVSSILALGFTIHETVSLTDSHSIRKGPVQFLTTASSYLEGGDKFTVVGPVFNISAIQDDFSTLDGWTTTGGALVTNHTMQLTNGTARNTVTHAIQDYTVTFTATTGANIGLRTSTGALLLLQFTENASTHLTYSTTINNTFPFMLKRNVPVTARFLQASDRVLIFLNGTLIYTLNAPLPTSAAYFSTTGTLALTAYAQRPVVLFDREPSLDVMQRGTSRVDGTVPPHATAKIVTVKIYSPSLVTLSSAFEYTINPARGVYGTGKTPKLIQLVKV